jgi:hypothetical protein
MSGGERPAQPFRAHDVAEQHLAAVPCVAGVQPPGPTVVVAVVPARLVEGGCDCPPSRAVVHAAHQEIQSAAGVAEDLRVELAVERED